MISEKAISVPAVSLFSEILSHSEDINRSSSPCKVSSFSAALSRTFLSEFLVSRTANILEMLSLPEISAYPFLVASTG